MGWFKKNTIVGFDNFLSGFNKLVTVTTVKGMTLSQSLDAMFAYENGCKGRGETRYVAVMFSPSAWFVSCFLADSDTNDRFVEAFEGIIMQLLENHEILSSVITVLGNKKKSKLFPGGFFMPFNEIIVIFHTKDLQIVQNKLIKIWPEFLAELKKFAYGTVPDSKNLAFMEENAARLGNIGSLDFLSGYEYLQKILSNRSLSDIASNKELVKDGLLGEFLFSSVLVLLRKRLFGPLCESVLWFIVYAGDREMTSLLLLQCSFKYLLCSIPEKEIDVFFDCVEKYRNATSNDEEVCRINLLSMWRCFVDKSVKALELNKKDGKGLCCKAIVSPRLRPISHEMLLHIWDFMSLARR